MTPTDKQSFDEAVTLAQAGRNQEAYAILNRLAPLYPDDSNILLWMAFTAGDLAKSKLMLGRVVMLDPQNPALASAKNWLSTQEKQAAPVTSDPVAVSAGPALPGSPSFSAVSPRPQSVPPELEPSGIVSETSQTSRTAKNKKAKSPKKPMRLAFRLLLIGGGVMLAIFLVFIGLGLLGVFNGPTITSVGIPVYTGSAKLDLSKNDREATINTFNLQNVRVANSGEFTAYIIKNGERNKALDFYDSDLKRQNWAASTTRINTPTLAGSAYLRANQGLILRIASGPAIPPSVANRVKSDEALLVTILFQLENAAPSPRA